MKVTIKGGSKKKNDEIFDFFTKEIMPLLKNELAVENSKNKVYNFCRVDDEIIGETDPTAEVKVELSPELLKMAMDATIILHFLENESDSFFNEVIAVRKIMNSKTKFSVEFYSVRYKPPAA